jgi:hypothetical protein
MHSFLRRVSLAAAFAALPMAVQAGAPNATPIPPAPSAAPLPTRVGRLGTVSGKVWWHAAGVSDWSVATPNFPIAAGAALRTDAQSRAVVEIGPHTLGLAPGSEIRLVALDRHLIELALPQGRLRLHLRRSIAGETAEIAIPRGEARLSAPGEYDIAAGGPNQPARITVFAGHARFAVGGAETVIPPDRAAALGGEKPIAVTQGPATADDFDLWSRAQDYRQTKLVAPYYISPEMTGYAALDGYGSWRNSDKYGEVWYPDGLPANWAPYRYGHWRRIMPWGWTWIDEEPWGFAPSHYGRWALIGRHWGWVPGHFTDDPAYMPAVVAFLGTPGVGLSVADSSTPAIGWFPLAPGEVYWPSYSRNLDYVRALNRGDVADPAAIMPDPDGNPPVEIVTGSFANRQMASVIPRPDFAAGHPVASALLQLPAERLADAPVITGSPRLGPAPAPRPEVAVAHAAPAVRSVAPRKPERIAARRAPERKPVAPRRVAEGRSGRPGRTIRSERHTRFAHLRAPGYAGRALRAHRLVAYHPRRAVRRGRH